jgi:hypothetical protein
MDPVEIAQRYDRAPRFGRQIVCMAEKSHQGAFVTERWRDWAPMALSGLRRFLRSGLAHDRPTQGCDAALKFEKPVSVV